MVRSHIGNVVCRKALCVRVASSPPKNNEAILLRCFFISKFICLYKKFKKAHDRKEIRVVCFEIENNMRNCND